MESKDFIRQSVSVYLLLYLSVPLGYIIRIMYARNLSIEEYGIIYALLGIFAVVSIFNDFGLSDALNYFAAQFIQKKDHVKLKFVVATTYMIQCLSALLIAVVFIVGQQYIEQLFFADQQLKEFFLFFIGYFFFLSLTKPIVILMAARGNFTLSKMGEPLRLLIILCVSSLIFVVPDNQLEVVGIAWMLSFALLFFVYLAVFFKHFSYLGKYRYVWDAKLFKKMVAFALPTMLTMGATLLMGKMDVLFISYFRNVSEVALYSTAFSVASVLVLMVNPIVHIIFPLTSKYKTLNKLKEHRDRIRLVYRYLLIAAFFILIIITGFSREIVSILFGAQYTYSWIALIVLAIGVLFSVLATLNYAIISGIGEPKQKTKAMIVVGLFNLVGNILVIPIMGYLGAAIITSAAFLLFFMLSMVQTHRLFGKIYRISDALRILLSGVIAITTGLALKTTLDTVLVLEVGIVFASVVLVYGVLCTLLRVNKFSDAKTILGAFFKKSKS